MIDLEERLDSDKVPQLPTVYHTKRVSSAHEGSSREGGAKKRSDLGINILPFRNQATTKKKIKKSKSCDSQTTPTNMKQDDMASLSHYTLDTPTSQQKTPTFPRARRRTTPTITSTKPPTKSIMSLTPPTNYCHYKTLSTRTNTPMEHVTRTLTTLSINESMSDSCVTSGKGHVTSGKGHKSADKGHGTKGKSKKKGYMDHMYFPAKAEASNNVSMATGDATLMISGDNHMNCHNKQQQFNHMTPNIALEGGADNMSINGQTLTGPYGCNNNNLPTGHMTSHMMSPYSHMTRLQDHVTSNQNSIIGYPANVTSGTEGHMTYSTSHMTTSTSKEDSDIYYDLTTSSSHMTSATRHMTPNKRRRYILSSSASTSVKVGDNKIKASQSTPPTGIIDPLPKIKLNPHEYKKLLLKQATPQFSQSKEARDYILNCPYYASLRYKGSATHFSTQQDHKTIKNNNNYNYNNNKISPKSYQTTLDLESVKDFELKFLKLELEQKHSGEFRQHVRNKIESQGALKASGSYERPHPFEEPHITQLESQLSVSSSEILLPNKVLRSNKTLCSKASCQSSVKDDKPQVVYQWNNVKPLLLKNTQYGVRSISPKLLRKTPTYQLPKVA